MRERILVVVIAAFIAITFAASVSAEKRVVLVIGNSAYTAITPLGNPKNDAILIAEPLSEVGFEVVSATDVDVRAMGQAQQPETALSHRYAAGDVFRECNDCPEMVVVPAGTLTMGSPASEEGRFSDEGPQHNVTIDKPFAVGRFEVTRGQFSAFVEATGYGSGNSCWVDDGSEWKDTSGKSWRDPGYARADDHPVTCASWDDSKAYAAWLSGETGEDYRLLSEAEWEYAARGERRLRRYPRYRFANSESDLCGYANGQDRRWGAVRIIETPGWGKLNLNRSVAYDE